MEILLRKQAKEQGAKRYFTGRPCKHGHIAARSTKTKICVDCSLMHSRRRHTEDVALNRSRSKAWRDANKDKANARAKAWHAANPERVRLIKKAWQDRNPDYVRANTANGRARRRNAQGRHSAADITAIFSLQRGRCANPKCRARIKDGYHRDHITPLSLGGTNSPKNLQLLCGPCNMSKGSKPPIVWAQRLGLLI